MPDLVTRLQGWTPYDPGRGPMLVRLDEQARIVEELDHHDPANQLGLTQLHYVQGESEPVVFAEAAEGSAWFDGETWQPGEPWSSADLTKQETDAVCAVLVDQLEGYWEVLKDEEPTLETAMAKYDADPLVTALSKLDAEAAAQLRTNTEAEVKLYLE